MNPQKNEGSPQNSLKLSILIPVYNEEETLRDLIARVEEVEVGDLDKEIIIVNDCSKDKSGEILRAYEKKHKVFHHEVNKGKGAAIRTALSHATGDYVIIQDADLEYDPGEYANLLKPILDGKADVVYGSRFLGKNTSRYQLYAFGNKFLSFMTSLLYFKRITDMETCYKMFKKSVLDSFTITCNRFDIEPEVTAKVLKKGYRLLEIPIHYEGRTKEQGKKIKPKDGLIALWVLIKYRFVD